MAKSLNSKYSCFRVGQLGKAISASSTPGYEPIWEKNALEAEAANFGGEVRARNTRQSSDKLAEAEAAKGRLGPKSWSLAVECLLTPIRNM
jgi:hypothetical protein